MSTNKPHKKRKKLKVKKFTFFLFILIIFCSLLYYLFTFKTKNIYIDGNDIYSDYEILKISKLNNYPPFLTTSTFLAELKLEKEPLIKSATISKSFLGTINIKINEYQPYFTTTDDTLVIENGTKIDLKDLDNLLETPLLISSLKKSLETELIDSFAEIDKTIIPKISEIEYRPSILDDERFLLLMADGNYVYVTLSKMENINYYSKVVTQLAGKKGIINFDSYRKNDAGITIDILK